MDDRRERRATRLDAEPARGAVRRTASKNGATRRCCFSSYAHGDPVTPLPQGLRRRPVRDPHDQRRARRVDALHVDGHRFFAREPATSARTARSKATPIGHDCTTAISERYTAILDGGAGGTTAAPGRLPLRRTASARRFRQGAWGIIRVLPKQVGRSAAAAGHERADRRRPPPGGDRRAARRDRATRATRARAAPRSGTCRVSAVDVPGGVDGRHGGVRPDGRRADGHATAAQQPEPLVAARGGRRLRDGARSPTSAAPDAGARRASFHVAELDADARTSSGVNVGFNRGADRRAGRVAHATATTRTRARSAARRSPTSATTTAGRPTASTARWSSPRRAPRSPTRRRARRATSAATVDVHVPGGRRATATSSRCMADNDPIIGGNFMPYPDRGRRPGAGQLPQRAARRRRRDVQLARNGDPATPLLQRVRRRPDEGARRRRRRAASSRTSFSLGGHYWQPRPGDRRESQLVQSQGIGPGETIDVELTGRCGRHEPLGRRLLLRRHAPAVRGGRHVGPAAGACRTRPAPVRRSSRSTG